MKRLLAAVAVPVLALSVLSGCSGEDETAAETGASASPSSPGDAGSGDADAGGADAESGDASDGAQGDPDAPGAGSEYCDLLGTDFASLFANIQGPEDVTRAIETVKKLADAAPPEVEEEWGLMSGALGDMQSALTRAVELQQDVAEGKVSQKELQQQTEKLMKDMEALDTPENNAAGEAVAKHASEYCGIDLG